MSVNCRFLPIFIVEFFFRKNHIKISMTEASRAPKEGQRVPNPLPGGQLVWPPYWPCQQGTLGGGSTSRCPLWPICTPCYRNLLEAPLFPVLRGISPGKSHGQ